ncbi:hypothetical protein Thiowin_00068 [Thiorhodovibrio winogradskyi]|uniref:DUF104 domain-containing protein n=1 Tax=Thiorhodovibrio winogradskyi TaxID=77007 RepID=A0ABZ0S1G0_9GAMM|nr:hypothetical protein [Thiorhodovibrio winogradskyi]
MLTTVEGIYHHGTINLQEPLANLNHARVLVTVLPDGPGESAPIKMPIKSLRDMTVAERASYLHEMRARWRNRQSSSEEFAARKREEIALENGPLEQKS